MGNYFSTGSLNGKNMKALLVVCIIFCSLSCGTDEEGNAIWNKEKNAVAFCLYEGESRCYVITGGNTINVSQVEDVKIGKLGIIPKEEYEKVLTVPVEWLDSENEILMVSFKSEAWLSGQKYTITEPVVIKNDNYVKR